MAKGDKKKVNASISQQQTNQKNQQNEMYPQFLSNYGNSRDDDQRTRAEIEEGFRNFNPSYNADDYLNKANSAYPMSGSGGGGGGSSSSGGGGGPINLQNIVGGINSSLITGMGTDPYAGYKKMSEGLRPEFWSDFNKYMSGFDESNKNLGSAAESYRGFMNTGGFSERDLQSMRDRALAPSRSIYQNAQDQLGTQMARAGLNPLAGQAFQSKQLREANQGIGDITVQNEANIAQQVQQGKLAGTAGLAGVGVSQAEVANMQANARTQVEELDQQMRAQGLGGMTDIEKARLSAHLTNQQITQAGQIATNQGILGKAQIEAQRRATSAGSSAAAAALAQRQREFEAGFRFDVDAQQSKDFLGKQNAWTNLYGTTPGATNMTGNQLLQGQNQFANQGMGLIGREIEASQMPGDYDIALGRIGNTVNLAGSALTLGTKAYKNQNPNYGGVDPYGGVYTDTETEGTY